MPSSFAVALRLLFAFILTVGLLVFLAATKALRASSSPSLSIRSLETLSPVALPAPPPPPPPPDTPPPPKTPDLPKLDIQLDSVAPPIKASLEREIDLRMEMTEFAPQNDAPREQMTFALRDLDNQPKLVNKLKFSYSAELDRLGIDEALVKLEILIKPSGRVQVLRVIDSPHPKFADKAISIASNAVFTPPKKDGRTVQATFQWPLKIRP